MGRPRKGGNRGAAYAGTPSVVMSLLPFSCGSPTEGATEAGQSRREPTARHDLALGGVWPLIGGTDTDWLLP